MNITKKYKNTLFKFFQLAFKSGMNNDCLNRVVNIMVLFQLLSKHMADGSKNKLRSVIGDKPLVGCCAQYMAFLSYS